MSEGPLYKRAAGARALVCRPITSSGVQGYHTHKKPATSLGPPFDPRHRPSVRS